MPQPRSRPGADRPPRPLDPAILRALAIRYVGRYATTGAKLTAYLTRKVAERGWAEEGRPPIAEIVQNCLEAGYVDDEAYAEAKARALARQGYGHRRVEASLLRAGVARDVTEALRPDDDSAFDRAETFARKRRIGRFGLKLADQILIRRQFAAMVRAGHSPQLAGYFVRSVPETDSDDAI